VLTRRTRQATVRAIGEASVLEFRAAGLDAVSRGFPEARQAMARFFKERLLENFLAVSPLFRNLDAVGRAALISHFQDRKVAAGEVLLAPGEVQNGIALVTSGCVVVTKRDGPGKDVQIARLTRGHYYGVVSALSGLPTRASISAPEPSTLCVLPQKAFNDFVKGYPVLRTLPARLHEAGEKVERDVFVGDATELG
jgi:CRP-like cAMP-binding protein